MFANRFTALIDACVLAGALKRNMLCSLAEAGFFRIRWSCRILDETEHAVVAMLRARHHSDAAGQAARNRHAMEKAFEEASVGDYDALLPIVLGRLPDQNDAHVIAAALQTQAQVIVTDNLRHFPRDILAELSLDARSSDVFIADTVALDPGRAVAALRMMRERLKKPAMDADALLLLMEKHGLVEAVDVLRPHARSL